MSDATATLARIRLNPYHRDVQRDLRYAAEMHRTLMRMLPDDLGATPRRDSGLLYRVEESQDGSVVLVQAATPLDPDRLPTGYGQTQIKDMAPVFAALRTGLPVRYRIAVNPSKRERLTLDRKGERGRVLPLTGAQADEWWARRADESGLHLHTAVPTPLPAAVSRPKDHVKHHLVRYDGTAVVTDPDLAATALLTGIGRGKSYGAGLLSLAPAASAAS